MVCSWCTNNSLIERRTWPPLRFCESRKPTFRKSLTVLLFTRISRRPAKIQYQQGIDYYAVLGLEEGASPTEVNKAWRREVLLHHPDKNPSLVIPSCSTGLSGASTPSGSEEQNAKIHLINQARLVLTDPVLREEWLSSFLSNAQQPQKPKEEGPHVFRHISLDEFEPCYASTTSRATGEAEDEEEPTHFVHPCRCGGEFLITTEQLEQGVDVVGCEGCGEWVRVGYEVVEEED